VDTAAFVALRNRSEIEHQSAKQTLEQLVKERRRLVTTNYVFAETYTALMVRVGRDEAIAWGRSLRSTDVVDLIRIDEEIEEEAWQILESHNDKKWSYVDATSFALMRREGASEAFTFDQNFAQRGLQMLPYS
jgi:predicted nucleic acid-binding protein